MWTARATSSAPSRSGRAATSALSTAGWPTAGRPARAAAARSMPGDRSQPTAVTPRSRRPRRYRPLPQPASSTRIPGARPARSRTQVTMSRGGSWWRQKRCRARSCRSSAYCPDGFNVTLKANQTSTRRTMGEDFRPVAPVDPTNLRPMLFLDVAHQIMLSPDWTHRAATIVLESHTGPGRFSFYGANHPGNIDRVHDRQVDVSILNPAAMLTMAHRGTGLYDRPRDVAVIATLPHDDRLGFAVADRLGFADLADIAAARYPLRVSVRGSIDACTPLMVDVVLKSHGFTLADLEAWGGQISYDQPMPNHPSRMGRLKDGELDAIFDEGVVMWAD